MPNIDLNGWGVGQLLPERAVEGFMNQVKIDIKPPIDPDQPSVGENARVWDRDTQMWGCSCYSSNHITESHCWRCGVPQPYATAWLMAYEKINSS